MSLYNAIFGFKGMDGVTNELSYKGLILQKEL